jgi:hypothetical protein
MVRLDPRWLAYTQLDGPAERAQAAGLAVNLWTGIALLVVAAIFLVRASPRPLGVEVDADADADADELSAPPA